MLGLNQEQIHRFNELWAKAAEYKSRPDSAKALTEFEQVELNGLINMLGLTEEQSRKFQLKNSA